MASKANKPFNYGSRYWHLYENARAKLADGVDYDSPKQMAWLLRDHLGYSITSLEGDESTGREVLERLADEGHEDVSTYLEWRKVNKLLTAFIPTFKKLQVGGVIHPIYNPDSTRTGRTSSERPNAQQIPPSLRPMFKARPGYKFVGYDAAAIEAKLIALYSEDPTLYEIIRSGVSIHDHNTKVFFGLDTPYEAVKKLHPNERAASKNVGFALFYHAGANRIRIAFAQKGYHLTDSECRELHRRFKASYSTAMEYAKEIVRWLEKGNVLPNLLGRPIRIEKAEDAYMKGFNTLIQSSASDYLLHAAHSALRQLASEGIEAHPLLFVHDFVCFEVEESKVETADTIIKNALIDFDLKNSLGSIELEVEGGVMSQWDK
jgi:DNA polymerase-1